MIKKPEDFNKVINNNMRNGQGEIIINKMYEENDTFNHVKMFSIITINPGCSIGQHEHHDECEIFYCNKGSATYYDDGNEVCLLAGQCAICQDGHSHGVKNDTDTPVEIIAAIVVK